MSVKPWPGDMSTSDLENLVGKLNAAVTALDYLPPEVLVRYRRIIDAFEVARTELARRRVREAHIALTQARFYGSTKEAS